MADDAVFLQEIVEDDPITKALQFGEIDGYGLRAARAIALGDFRGNRLAIGDHPVDNAT